MTPRNVKQILISIAYTVLFGLIIFWIYKAFFYVAPTCSDWILNQDEIVVDKGGVCGDYEEVLPAVDMQIKEAALVYGGVGHSDALVKIYNPNDRYGASKFSYTLSLKDATGAVVATKKASSYILPKETKYLTQVGIETSTDATSVEIAIDSVEWQLFAGYQEKPVINVYSKRYGPVASGVGFGQVEGTLSNESGFDFQVLVVKVVLRDAAGKPVAINQTEMRTVIADERRDIGPLVFPSYFPGDVASVETEAEADVYRSDNFIRQYFPGGAFQKL